MSIFSKIFGKKQTSETDEIVRVGGMEDFMTLIRVYYQSVMAAQLGISNINFLPDMAVFKRTLKIPTQNNKLGIAGRSKCKKMLSDIYGLIDVFFKEIDNSMKKTDWKDDGVRKTCHNIRMYQHTLGYSESWMTEYVYNIVLLAKKEPKPKA